MEVVTKQKIGQDILNRVCWTSHEKNRACFLGAYILYSLLVGSFNPFEKYARQNGFIFPNFRHENKKIIELPPPSL